MSGPGSTITPKLTETQQAVSNYFEAGGSWAAALAVVLAVGGVVLLAYLLTRRQRRRHDPVQPADPHRLFRDLLDKLTLTNRQRRFLATLASDLHLVSPATMLLCPAVFDQRVTEWQSVREAGARRAASARSGSAGNREPDAVAQLRAVLFPGQQRLS
jgi:hypothetical protein